jgi:uncharacterized protein YggE
MKLIIPFLFALLVVIPTFSQEHPAVTAQPNSVYVGADGKFEAAPDTALIQFNISAQADTSKAAYDLASKQAEQTRQVLKANGIEPKSAEFGFFSVQPMYDWKNAKRKIVGYQVIANVSLKLKDFSRIGPITQQLTDADVSQGQSVSYTLDNVDDAKNKAVEDAYRRARASAETIAKASGRALGEMSYASVDTFENLRVMPMQRGTAMMSAAAAAPPPQQEFTPQQVTVTAHVNAVFTLK